MRILGSPGSLYSRFVKVSERSDEDHHRLVKLEERIEAEHLVTVELDRRMTVLSRQLGDVVEMIETLDPRGSRDIAIGVRDSVSRLSVELTEQANQTAELLARLSNQDTSAQVTTDRPGAEATA